METAAGLDPGGPGAMKNGRKRTEGRGKRDPGMVENRPRFAPAPTDTPCELTGSRELSAALLSSRPFQS